MTDTIIAEGFANRIVDRRGGVPGTLRISDGWVIHTPWLSLPFDVVRVATSDVRSLDVFHSGWFITGIEIGVADNQRFRFHVTGLPEWQAALRHACPRLPESGQHAAG